MFGTHNFLKSMRIFVYHSGVKREVRGQASTKMPPTFAVHGQRADLVNFSHSNPPGFGGQFKELSSFLEAITLR